MADPIHSLHLQFGLLRDRAGREPAGDRVAISVDHEQRHQTVIDWLSRPR